MNRTDDPLANGLIVSPQRNPNIIRMAQYFRYGHLPKALQDISCQYAALAQSMVDAFNDGPELTEMLKKLWEAKNLAVIAAGFIGSLATREEKIARGDVVEVYDNGPEAALVEENWRRSHLPQYNPTRHDA